VPLGDVQGLLVGLESRVRSALSLLGLGQEEGRSRVLPDLCGLAVEVHGILEPTTLEAGSGVEVGRLEKTGIQRDSPLEGPRSALEISRDEEPRSVGCVNLGLIGVQGEGEPRVCIDGLWEHLAGENEAPPPSPEETSPASYVELQSPRILGGDLRDGLPLVLPEDCVQPLSHTGSDFVFDGEEIVGGPIEAVRP
jgi:hypothetical protein